MGGHSEKKTKIYADRMSHNMTLAIMIVNGIYLAVNLLYALWNFDTYDLALHPDITGFLLFSAVSYATYNSMKNTYELGLKPEYMQDVFIINLGVQSLVGFSYKAWYLYLLIPAYLMYKISGYVWSYLKQPKYTQQEDEGEEDPRERKRREKKEKKEKKPKYKVIK